MKPATKMVPGSVCYPGLELWLPEPQEVALPRELQRVAMLTLPLTPQARAVAEEVAQAGIASGGLLLLVADPCSSFSMSLLASFSPRCFDVCYKTPLNPW